MVAASAFGATLRIDNAVQSGIADELRQAAGQATSETAGDSARAVLGRHGYLDPTISLAGDTIVISPGIRSYLHAIISDRDSVVHLPQPPFTPDAVDEALDRVLAPHRDSGRYFARATIERISRESNLITLHVTVAPGPSAVVTDQHLSGLTRTNPELIWRYLPLSEGDTLTSETLARAEQAARAIPFVRLKQPPRIRLHPGYTGVTITWPFAERRQTGIEGLIGYAPEDSRALVWTADLHLLNPFGGGRDLHVTSQRRDRGRDILNIAYAQPVFWLGPGQFSASLATRDYREQFYEFKARAGYTTALTFGTRVGLDLTWRSVEDDISRRSYTTYQAAATITRTSLDQPRNPSSGYTLDWSVAYHHRRYDSDSTTLTTPNGVLNDTRLSARIALFQPIAAGFVGHLVLSYEGLETNEELPPLSELIFVGGPGSLRGYRTEQFTAIRTAALTVEPRWRFDQGALFAFYDGAYLNNRIPGGDHAATEESWRYGYGFGMMLSDTTRRISLSLGWHPGIPADQPRLAVQLGLHI